MNVTAEIVDAALKTFVEAVNECAPCKKCVGRGYHHGFGENGHDPDWCDVCGGSGFTEARTEREAMKLALIKAATLSSAQRKE